MRFTNCVSNQPAARCGARATTLGVSLTPLLMTLAHAADFGPVIEKPAFVIPGTQAGHFGASVSTAGDINGDGYSDLVVGEPAYSNGQIGEGRALLYLGSATGVGTVPSWSFETNQIDAALGASVATAGDVNGDGFHDVLLGAPGFDRGERDEGRVLLFLGSTSGLSATPAWSHEIDLAFAAFGASVATAGDVDGDGYADCVIGAPGASLGAHQRGAAILFRGGPTGLASTGIAFDAPLAADSGFGASVASAGDLDGDGFAEVLIGAPGFDQPGLPDCGAFYVFRGSASGIATTPSHSFFGDTASAHLGASVSLAGDANGDGRSDCLVGAPGAGTSRQGHALYFETDVSGSPILERTFVGNQPFGRFGAAVATAGDLNGDGRADAIVGAPNQDHDGKLACGAARVFLGLAKGLNESNSLSLFGDSPSGAFGGAVATAGDSNGNGYSDLAIGAPEAKFGKGAVVGYHGAGGLPSPVAVTAIQGKVPANFATTLSIEGDYDGDGFSDLLAGASFMYAGLPGKSGRAFVYRGSPTGLEVSPSWQVAGAGQNFYFSQGVASAGDVNGDGFDDALVSDPDYSNGQIQEGAVYLYLGSSLGLSTTPAWIAEGNHAYALFGTMFASVGDINSDGFIDVASASYNSVPAAPLRITLGSPTGGDPSIAQAFKPYTTTGNSYFVRCVEGARDTNGDGYDDVLFGIDEISGSGFVSGRLMIFRGGPTGVTTTPAWLLQSNSHTTTADITDASAGDFDSDGFADILLGKAFVHHEAITLYRGSPTGPGTTPSWTHPHHEFDLAGQRLCHVGDCDGDGFEDFAFGCPAYSNGLGGTGRVRLIRGSVDGPIADSPWSFVTDTSGFNLLVSGGGDVNGDGFSDIAIGEPGFYTPSGSEVGRIDLVLGNGALGNTPSGGTVRGISQRRVLNPTRIGPNQISDSSSSFVTTALGRGAAGRERVALDVEVKPVGTKFDGQGLLSSSWQSTGAPASAAVVGSATPITLTIGNLAASSRFHWRQRVRTRNPFFPSSPWFSILNRGIEETHVRTR